MLKELKELVDIDEAKSKVPEGFKAQEGVARALELSLGEGNMAVASLLLEILTGVKMDSIMNVHEYLTKVLSEEDALVLIEVSAKNYIVEQLKKK